MRGIRQDGRLDSRNYTWFAVVTPPQKEFVAEKVLANEGFATFLPTRKEWRFRNKIARMKRQKHEVTYPLMPRYVFIGMSEGTPGWERVMPYAIRRFIADGDGQAREIEARLTRRPLVQYIVGVDGEPFEIPADPLWRLMVEYNRGRFNAPGYHQFMQTHREFTVGDTVVTEDGLFEGVVRQIEGHMAKVFIQFFGDDREVEVALEKLVAA